MFKDTIEFTLIDAILRQDMESLLSLSSDFRGLSRESDETVRERPVPSRTRRNRSEESRRSHQRSRRDSGPGSRMEIRDNSLHVIKTIRAGDCDIQVTRKSRRSNSYID